MNVLLAEANVPYDAAQGDGRGQPRVRRAPTSSLVIGANDVVNPAAKNDPSSPISGMPILDVDEAQRVIVLKRSMRPGFAGIDNDLFYEPNTSMLFGDAKAAASEVAAEIENL